MPKHPDGRSTRLLVVDDDPAFARMIASVGEGLGMATETVSTGREFMTAFASRQPDVVVLDIVMPEMDGMELVGWLGNEGYDGQLIIVSGYGSVYSESAIRLAEARCQAEIRFLQKPAAIEEIETALLGSRATG